MKIFDLKRFRKDKKISQTKLAEMLGVGQSFISQIESGKDPERGWFQLSWLQPMVRDYDVSAKWLLTGFGKMFEK